MTTLPLSSARGYHAAAGRAIPDTLPVLLVDALLVLRAGLPTRLTETDGAPFRNAQRQVPSLRGVGEMILTAKAHGATAEDCRVLADAVNHFIDVAYADAPAPTLEEALQAAVIAQAADDVPALTVMASRCPATMARLRDQTMRIITYSRALAFTLNRLISRRAA